MTDPRQTDPRVQETTEKAVDTLFGLGRLWATHGLTIGRAALETSATTLRMTSELLGQISDNLAEEAAAMPEDEPADEPGDAIVEVAPNED